MSEDQVPPSPPESPPPPPPPPPPAAAPPPAPPSPGGSGSSNRTIMIILAYFGPLALIPFLVEKEDREVQWHAKHGLVLFGAEIVLWIVLIVLNIAITAVFAPLACLTTIGFFFLGLAIMVFHIMCMVKGVNGERLKVPQLSEFADRF